MCSLANGLRAGGGGFADDCVRCELLDNRWLLWFGAVGFCCSGREDGRHGQELDVILIVFLNPLCFFLDKGVLLWRRGIILVTKYQVNSVNNIIQILTTVCKV